MDHKSHEEWLDFTLPKQRRMTEAVVSIVENLLRAKEVDYLSVSGRTKEKLSALEKIKRKGYRRPKLELTDLSGIRVVVFLESDVQRVLELLSGSFRVDKENSLNKDDLMSPDQIGYRSVHLVCDLGAGRCALPEFEGMAGLTFEFQVRTLLQHAWAELAHDRNYKFSGKLPKAVERKMYLYAGMLEIADKGFDEISSEIDQYVASLEVKSAAGDLSSEINSLSLKTFFENWALKSQIPISDVKPKDDLSDLIAELGNFGIRTLADLDSIVPSDYAEIVTDFDPNPSIYGSVRDWMLLKDWRLFRKQVPFNWVLTPDELPLYQKYFDEEEFAAFSSAFDDRYDEEDEEFPDEQY